MVVKGILTDINCQGHWDILLGRLVSDRWREVWTYLNLQVETLERLELPPETSDAVIWRVCQERQLILVTSNRNQEGPDSLEATIRTDNTAASLPVFTLANAEQIRNSRIYAERVTERLLEFLLDIDNYRGTGRLYLP
jgi:hypothetical protein